GVPSASAARALNVVLFPLTVLLAAAMAWSVGGNVAAAGTALILGTSPVLLEIFANAWSEPLFLVLALAALFALERATADPRWVLPAGLIAGISVLDRYAGIALVATGVLVLLWRRITLAVLYGAVAVLPLALWIARDI